VIRSSATQSRDSPGIAAAAETGAPGTGIRHALRALRHRNFRLFFAGQSISLVGTWMQQVAMGWLVYRLTGSAFVLGVVAFASHFPIFMLAPVAGALADRWSRHRIVVATQLVSMVQALVLAALVLAGAVEVWHIVALSGLLGLASAFDIPARQSLLVELVRGQADLANAIALNSSMFNGARLVGPAIAGVLVAVIGEGPVFVLNGLSYVAVLAALFALELPARPPPTLRLPLVQALREGVAHVVGFEPFRVILLLLAAISLTGMPYVVLLPVFASDILGGGPHTLGFLVSGAGLGALCGALVLAARRTVRGLGRVIVACVLLSGAGLVAFALSRHTWVSVPILFFVGFGMMVQSAASNTVLQTIVADDMRGRVMSLYTMALMGMTPLGSLAYGAAAGRIGAPATVALGGVACILAGAWFARGLPKIRARLRSVYISLGILPEVATAMQTATELRPRG
jgi:MFS family permease